MLCAEMRLNCSFSLFCKCGECRRVVYGEVCKNFSVEVDAGNFKTVHKFGIRKAVDSCCSVYPGDPEAAHIALPELSALERIVQRLHHRFTGDPVRL